MIKYNDIIQKIYYKNICAINIKNKNIMNLKFERFLMYLYIISFFLWRVNV
jgi:hypothetical protein